MKCEICGKDALKFVLLNIKKPDGCLNTIACLECAKKSPAYCNKHENAHLGFEDGSTACVGCIEEEVKENEIKGSDIINDLQQKLPKVEFDRLMEWANDVVPLTGNTDITCILRALITRALRIHKEIDEVIIEVIEEKSVNSILPLAY